MPRRRIEYEGSVRRRPWEFFTTLAKSRTHGILVDVVAVMVVARRILHAQLFEAVFPDRQFGLKAEGKTSLDELHSLLDGDVRRGGEEEMEVVRHEHESMDLISTLRSIFVQQIQKELGVGFDLKKPAAIRGNRGDEVRAEFLRGKVVHVARLAFSAGNEKMTIVRNGPGLKPRTLSWHHSTA